MTTRDEIPWRERSRLVYAVRLFRTRNPVSFTDKVRYKMLRDRRPLLITFADKAAVRGYVADRVGERYLPRVHALTGHPADLASLELPECSVLKPTHASGACIVISSTAPGDHRLPAPGHWGYSHVRPDRVSRDELVRTAEFWCSQVYGQGPNREWAYGQVKPRVIVEELLQDEHGGIPDDYKFFVFHGQVKYVQVDHGRFARRTQDFFDAEWNHLPLSGGPPWADPTPARPARLAEMIRMACALGQDTDFVRVDLYHLPDRVVFGELTSYPAGGDSPFDPEYFNTRFGSHWTVPRRYR